MFNRRVKRNTEDSPGGPNADPDHDRLSNRAERRLGTDPLNPDTDNDGIPDRAEVRGSYHGRSFSPTDPRRRDSDHDRVSDGQEVRRGDNPNNKD